MTTIDIWFDTLSVMQKALITGIKTRDYDDCIYPLHEFEHDCKVWWNNQTPEEKQEIYNLYK